MAAAGDMGMGGEQAQPAGARMGADDKPDSDRPGQGRTAPGSSSDEHGIPGNQPLPNAGGSRSGTGGSNRGPTERQ